MHKFSICFLDSCFINEISTFYSDDIRYNHFVFLIQAQKPWAKKYLKLQKAKKDYHAACRQEKSATNQENNARADSSVSPDHVSFFAFLDWCWNIIGIFHEWWVTYGNDPEWKHKNTHFGAFTRDHFRTLPITNRIIPIITWN